MDSALLASTNPDRTSRVSLLYYMPSSLSNLRMFAHIIECILFYVNAGRHPAGKTAEMKAKNSQCDYILFALMTDLYTYHPSFAVPHILPRLSGELPGAFLIGKYQRLPF